MSYKDMVSVIMPVKFDKKDICPAIKSILNQTYNNIELLIIGKIYSNKSTFESFQDERIKLIENDGNISKALNVGLSIANGKYIMRMDSDDFCTLNKLETQMNALKTKKVDVVGCNVNYIDSNNILILKKIFPEYDRDIRFFMPINVSLSHSAMLTYKSVFDKVGLYNETMSKAEDLELFLRMIDKGIKFYNVQDQLYSYRIKDEIWDIDNINNIISYKLSLEYLNQQMENSLSADQSDNILRRALLEYYKGSMSVARKYFLKYIKLNPGRTISLSRYLFISIFIGKSMKKLRKYKIPQKVNLYFHKYFKKDLQYKSRP